MINVSTRSHRHGHRKKRQYALIVWCFSKRPRHEHYLSTRLLQTKLTRRPAPADRTARRQFQATGQQVSRTQATGAMTSWLPRYEAKYVQRRCFQCGSVSAPLPLGGELGSHLTQCGQGRGLPACQVSSWSVQPFGHSARTLQTDRQTDRQENGPIA